MTHFPNRRDFLKASFLGGLAAVGAPRLTSLAHAADESAAPKPDAEHGVEIDENRFVNEIRCVNVKERHLAALHADHAERVHRLSKQQELLTHQELEALSAAGVFAHRQRFINLGIADMRYFEELKQLAVAAQVG